MFEKLRDNDELPPEEKTVRRLTDEATILIIAASESPAKAFSLIHFHLLRNPPILQRVQDEIINLLPDHKTMPSLTQLEQAPYLSAVIKQGLRLHGGITARTQRVASNEDLHYQDWVIPRVHLQHSLRLRPPQPRYLPGSPGIQAQALAGKGSNGPVVWRATW
jgi:cytochrome P450